MSRQLQRSLALSFALAACTNAPDEDTDAVGPDVADASDDGKADSGSTLRVRAGAMTVWVDRNARISQVNGELVMTVRGRASRTLTGAFSFVPDDAFGSARVVSTSSFEVDLRGGHEINSVLSGMPLFVDLDVATGNEPDYALRLELAPAFVKFSGSSSLNVNTFTAPIFVGKDVPDPLRYQAQVSTSATTPLSVAGAAAQVYPSRGGFAVDLTYDSVDAVLRGTGAVTFAQGSASKVATLGVRTRAIALATADAYDAWPEPTCNVDVYNCALEYQGVDLATCGSYREVSRCAYADICEVTNEAPLSLAPLGLAFVWDSALDDYRDGCSRGGSWCRLDTIEAFMLPECLAEVPTLADVVTRANALTDDQSFAGGDFASGTVLDRAGVQGTPAFSTSYSGGGPSLFQAIDAHMGAGEIQGWQYTEEVPCHNCTDFRTKLILWWPAAFRVVVLEGGHGYDS
ncbi:MAG: hypothetical protein SFX73_05425 [Kofleriaceae bacterium]|nr:hypothetical protein [Kofleriaceae bacterium]